MVKVQKNGLAFDVHLPDGEEIRKEYGDSAGRTLAVNLCFGDTLLLRLYTKLARTKPLALSYVAPVDVRQKMFSALWSNPPPAAAHSDSRANPHLAPKMRNAT
jgi:hypothetical protein